jgi:hypothetical protein
MTWHFSQTVKSLLLHSLDTHASAKAEFAQQIIDPLRKPKYELTSQSREFYLKRILKTVSGLLTVFRQQTASRPSLSPFFVLTTPVQKCFWAARTASRSSIGLESWLASCISTEPGQGQHYIPTRNTGNQRSHQMEMTLLHHTPHPPSSPRCAQSSRLRTGRSHRTRRGCCA